MAPGSRVDGEHLVCCNYTARKSNSSQKVCHCRSTPNVVQARREGRIQRAKFGLLSQTSMLESNVRCEGSTMPLLVRCRSLALGVYSFKIGDF